MAKNENAYKSTTGTKPIAVVSTGLSGFLLLISESFIPKEYLEIALATISIISPAISWILLVLYCIFIEPVDMIACRARLKRDLKNYKRILKDPLASGKVKKDAQDMYDRTLLAIASLNKNDSSIQISGNSENNET